MTDDKPGASDRRAEETPATGTDPNDQEAHPARPEQTQHGFEEGIDHKPDSPEESDIGRFSTGIEQTPKHSPEKEEVGRFSEGIEHTPDTPENAAERRFSEGIEQSPESDQ